MTIDELTNLYYLNYEIKAYDRRLCELEAGIGPRSASMEQKVRHSSTESQVERDAIRIAELKDLLAERRDKCLEEQARLQRWIDGIPNARTRLIFWLRFGEALSWGEVRDRMGCHDGVDNIKRICYEYLRDNP